MKNSIKNKKRPFKIKEKKVHKMFKQNNEIDKVILENFKEKYSKPNKDYKRMLLFNKIKKNCYQNEQQIYQV